MIPPKSTFKRFTQSISRWIFKHTPQDIKSNFHNRTFSEEGIERFIAFILDILSALILSLFPLWGWLLGIAYLLTKDALPIFDGRSIGKYYMNLRIVNKGTIDSITNNYKKSIIRGIVMLTPILNLVDIYHYLISGERLADKWADTIVIRNIYYINNNK